MKDMRSNRFQTLVFWPANLQTCCSFESHRFSRHQTFGAICFRDKENEKNEDNFLFYT